MWLWVSLIVRGLVFAGRARGVALPQGVVIGRQERGAVAGTRGESEERRDGT